MDQTGKRYGRYMVVDRAPNKTFGTSSVVMWNLRCDCGELRVCSGKNLRKMKSCGCHQRDQKELLKRYLKRNKPKPIDEAPVGETNDLPTSQS